MTTLEPGIHDPGEAPWWMFKCEGYDPVIRQWMGEAAAVFAAVLASRNAGGEVTYLHCDTMTDDGMEGTYVVTLSEHGDREFELIVERGDQQPAPEE